MQDVKTMAENTNTFAHDAVTKVEDKAIPAVRTMATTAHSTIDKLSSVADTAAEKFNLSADQISKAQTKFTETCKAQIDQNPLAAIGIAVAAGFLLSRIISSR